MALGFGVVVGQARPFVDLLNDWLLIESLGYDNAWLIDHFAPPFNPQGPYLESWTTLAALSARTERIRVGVAVTNAAVRNPGLLCKEAITVDHISGGRLEMAIGAGYYEEEQRMLGINFLDAHGRAERLREVVQALDLGLRGGAVTVEGKHWRLDALTMLPPAAQKPRPPIWVAAQGTFSLRTAALYGDVLVTMGDPDDPREQTLTKLTARFRKFSDICLELGREASSLRRAYLVGWADDRAFESDRSFNDLVESYAQAGVTDFLFALSQRSESVQGATRESLEQVASSLDSLRARSAHV